MGWPKKNEGLRLYFERKGKSYLLVDPSRLNGSNSYDAIGELLINNDPENPKLCTTSVSPAYIHSACKRSSWSEMPIVWQQAFLNYLNEKPEKYRGLWKIEELKLMEA